MTADVKLLQMMEILSKYQEKSKTTFSLDFTNFEIAKGETVKIRRYFPELYIKDYLKKTCFENKTSI